MATDLLTATQDALFAALSAAIPTNLAPVYQHVPENTPPPYIIVGDIEAEQGPTKGTEDIAVEVYSVHRGKGRRGVMALMHAVREAIEAAELAAPGADLDLVEWLNSAAGAADDGVTYLGVQAFRIIAEESEA